MNKGLQAVLTAKVYDVAIETPLELAKKLSAKTGNKVYLKREDLQPVQSFKLRGAYNKIINLTESEKAKGVIAASAGNHAQGVALSAKKLGISAHIVMPETTPAIKVEAVKSYGAKVELFGDSYSDAYERTLKLVDKTGRTFVHPFDDPLVIAGQGTVGREILEQLPDTDYIFVPVGGGGLIAGIAQYAKQVNPKVKIISVQSEDADNLTPSLKTGKREYLKHVGIFSDGTAVKQIGVNTFRIIKSLVDDHLTVSVDQICAAIKNCFEETRTIVEPAGALGLAGMQKYAKKHNLKNKNLVAICSGSNITFERLQFIAERTLVGSGREALFSVAMPERAGALRTFCTDVVNGHSITEFNYRLNARDKAHIFVGISISSDKDKQTFINKMAKNGYDNTDLSEDNLSKEHIRHMIGGPAPSTKNEKLYEINFPERPGALGDFLNNLGDHANISLFHYRGVGADSGSVLIGFENAQTKLLESIFNKSNVEFEPASSKAAQIFL